MTDTQKAAIDEIRIAQSKGATITIQQIACALNRDEKSIRRFMRSIIDRELHAQKGGRWAIDAKAFDAIAMRFAQTSNRTARTITIDDLK